MATYNSEAKRQGEKESWMKVMNVSGHQGKKVEGKRKGEKKETDPESKVGKKRTGTGLKKKSRHGRSKKKKTAGK